MSYKTGPQQLRACVVLMSAEQSQRGDAFAYRVGRAKAAKRLGISDQTLEAARDQGRMLASTCDRILDALLREEPLP